MRWTMAVLLCVTATVACSSARTHQEPTPGEPEPAGASAAEPPLGPEAAELPDDDRGSGTEAEPCYCHRIYRPVCGEDGTTYPNECVAQCAGVAVAAGGRCEGIEGCVCPQVYEPVCGVNGTEYSNECFASCAGVLIAYEGECRPGCTCPDVVDPVCGVDGHTHLNACEAACRGADVLHDGPCREAWERPDD
jgi:hypothetical protein